eukprot:gb/GECH01011336.1/.p1 GENE.gb/GECH01011336.1/~~gb/GECH01011336.1/.p1  ORF type:complete len:179 (+),score=63.17 gb/GECH01011336.1/:1-537(+)
MTLRNPFRWASARRLGNKWIDCCKEEQYDQAWKLLSTKYKENFESQEEHNNWAKFLNNFEITEQSKPSRTEAQISVKDSSGVSYIVHFTSYRGKLTEIKVNRQEINNDAVGQEEVIEKRDENKGDASGNDGNKEEEKEGETTQEGEKNNDEEGNNDKENKNEGEKEPNDEDNKEQENS